jgi:hypothetical protein
VHSKSLSRACNQSLHSVSLVSPVLEERVLSSLVHCSTHITLGLCGHCLTLIQTLTPVMSCLPVLWPLWEGDSCGGTRGLLARLSARPSILLTSSFMLHWGLSEKLGSSFVQARKSFGEFSLCGLVVRVSGYTSKAPGFDSLHYQIFREIVGLERGLLSLMRATEELSGRRVAAPI